MTWGLSGKCTKFAILHALCTLQTTLQHHSSEIILAVAQSCSAQSCRAQPYLQSTEDIFNLPWLSTRFKADVLSLKSSFGLNVVLLQHSLLSPSLHRCSLTLQGNHQRLWVLQCFSDAAHYLFESMGNIAEVCHRKQSLCLFLCQAVFIEGFLFTSSLWFLD